MPTSAPAATGVSGDAAGLATDTRARIERVFGAGALPADPTERAALLAWLALSRIGVLAPAADIAATSRAWYDELRLPAVLAAGLRDVGLDEGEAWATADLVRVLLALPRPAWLRGPARTLDGRLLEQWLARDVVRTAIGLNTWQGVEYVDRDAFARMLGWAVRLDAVEAVPKSTRGVGAGTGLVERLSTAAAEAGYRIDRLRAALAPAAAAPRSARRAPERGSRRRS